MNHQAWVLCLGAICLVPDISLSAPLRGSEPQLPTCVLVLRGIRPQEVALSPCEKYLAVAGYQAGNDEANSLLLVWNLETRKEVFRYANAEGGLLTVAFSPSGKQIIAGGIGAEKSAAKVWEFPSGKALARLENGENIQRLRYAPDGKSIAMATLLPKKDCHGVIVWDTENYKKRSVFRAGNYPIFSLAFSPDGKLLACGDSSGLVRVWKFAARENPREVTVDKGFILGLCFGRANKLLAVGTGPSDLGGRICLFPNEANVEGPATALKAQEYGVLSLLFGQDDKWVFAGGAERPPEKKFGTEGTVQVWKIAVNRLHANFRAHSLPVLTMALTQNGQTLITASMDETVKVWSLPKGFYKENESK